MSRFKPTPVPPELVERLRQRGYYGPSIQEGAADAPKNPPGYDAETEVIKHNKKHPNASKQHPFHPAEWTHPNGHPRCLMCGSEEPVGGVCNTEVTDAKVTDVKGPQVVPVVAGDEEDAAKIAAGIDAGVDQALVLLRSTPDLPEYAEQARDLLQGIEPACDALLDYFGLDDPDDSGEDQATQEKLARDVAFTAPRYLEPRLERPAFLPDSKAFIEEINGKTILTTQAAVDLERAMTSHEHYLWTQGRLVGADQPNRNGAFWSSQDLELGQTTVPYGPLNWLHEEKHVIGSIAAASYTIPGEQADALGTAQNHIAIAAPVWRWLYPDEAAVVELAAEAGKFWYSMECISKTVSCIGDNGCGCEVGYFDYMQGINGTCEHLVQRSSVRKFNDPIFLGAAVIVPPVRPGWADADAAVRQAAALAERAFDAAGRPDMAASDWEQLMAQVVRFATS